MSKKITLKNIFSNLDFRKACLLLLLFSFSLVLIWFQDRNIMGGGESGLLFYNLTRYLDLSKYSWTDLGLGNVVGVTTAATPTYWFLTLLQNIGLPNFSIQALFFLVIIFIACTSVYLLQREIFPNVRAYYALLGAIFYLFNPISMVNIWNRFLYNYMVFWALLPLSLFLFLKGLKNKKYVYSILTSLSTAILSFALTSTVFNFILWFILIFTVIYVLYSESGNKLFHIKYLLITFISYILFNFWWISQIFSFIFSSGYSASVSLFFNYYGNIGTLTSISQRLGLLSNIFRLLHITFFSQGPNWARSYIFPAVVLFEFTLTAVIIWAIIIYRQTREVIFLGTIFMISIFLMKGNNPPFGEIFQFFFIRIPALQVFRNPFEKFSFLLLLVTTPLLTFTITKLVESVKNKKTKKNITYAFWIFTILLFGFSFWSGLIFTYQDTTKGNKLVTYEVEVPQYYKEVNSWFKAQGEGFRFIALPIGGEGITYDWNKQYSGVDAFGVLFDTPNVSFNTSIPYYINFVDQISKYQLNEKLINFFRYANIEYVVLRKDINYQERRMANPEDAEKSIIQWENENLLLKVYDFGKLSVYKINNNYIYPKIYIANDVIITNESDLSIISDFGNGSENKGVIVGIDDLKKNIPWQRLELYPSDINIQAVTSPVLKDMSNEDIMARLFYVKHLPGEIFYPIFRIREKLEELSQNDYFGWIIYENGILGKRAVEIFKLRQNAANPEIIAKAENDYKKLEEKLEPTFLSFVHTNNNVSSLIKNSLIYQWLLLDRSNSGVSDLVSQLLTNWGLKPKFELPVSPDDYIVYMIDCPASGAYSLNIDGITQKDKVFFDGNLLESYELIIDKGRHEIAINLQTEELYKKVADGNGQLLSNSATVNWKISIPNIPTKYRITFDYRFVRGDAFNIKFKQNIDMDSNPVFNNAIRKDKLYHGWNKFDAEFTSSMGAVNGTVSFGPSQEEYCDKTFLVFNKCGLRDSDFEVEVNNLNLYQENIPEVSLSLAGDDNIGLLPEVDWEKINPTLYKVKIDKIDNTPQVLVFSELFNSEWEIVYADNQSIASDTHILVNDYANGWLIDKQGEYELTLLYKPQRLLNIGKIVSAFFVSATVILLIFLIHKKEKYL